MEFRAIPLIGCLVALNGCLSTHNSFEADSKTYAGISGTDPESRARGVIQATCLACHSGQTSPDLTASTESLVHDGWLVPGAPDISYLIQKVEGTSGSLMPKPPYPPLTADQIQVLRDWVTQVQ